MTRLWLALWWLVLVVPSARGADPPPYIIDAPFLGTAQELSDVQFTFSNFINPASGAAVTPATLGGRVHDRLSETMLYEFTLPPPTGKISRHLMASEFNIIVRPGFCSTTTAQVCSASAACPAGETCNWNRTETHVLTIEWTTADGGHGTKDYTFDVHNAQFLPFP